MNRILTVGAVIHVPEPFAAQVREARAVAGDPLAHVVPAHITLLPPTVVEVRHLSALHAHVARVGRGTAPFDVELAGTASFRPVNPVVFVRVAAGGEECTRLAAQVRDGPVERPLEYPYHPHVTLAQNVPEVDLDAVQRRMARAHFAFRVTEFGLYERREGQHWSPLDVVRLLGERVNPGRSA